MLFCEKSSCRNFRLTSQRFESPIFCHPECGIRPLGIKTGFLADFASICSPLHRRISRLKLKATVVFSQNNTLPAPTFSIKKPLSQSPRLFRRMQIQGAARLQAKAYSVVRRAKKRRRNAVAAPPGKSYFAPQHFLYFFPLPHGQASLRPTVSLLRVGALGPASSPWLTVA